jgi:ubiquinone/menaquinone biosynthesis C-methylase UbiE
VSLVSQFARPDAQPDTLVDFLDQVDSELAIRKARAAVAREIAQSGDKILDLGCGVGGATLMFAEEVGSNGRVAGVDINASLIQVATRRAAGRRGVEFQVGEAASIPYSTAYFDAAYCERVLLYVPDRLTALKELRRVVRPGGSICLVDTDFDATAIYSSHRKLTRKLTSAVAAAVPNPNSARELPALARLAGLDNVQVELSAVSTPYRFMMHAMGGVLREAVARGEISETEFDEWRNEQAHLHENGDFFQAWLFVRVMATVP